MSFNNFLDIMQKVFKIFRDEGGHMAVITQVCNIFRRVQHPQIQDTFKALEVIAELEGITYSEAANNLTDAHILGKSGNSFGGLFLNHTKT